MDPSDLLTVCLCDWVRGTGFLRRSPTGIDKLIVGEDGANECS